uniref:Homologous-pairing protein 2 winged helix domain-containing protein n=1 Tax=Sinocyclocheilus grahami TaxID=75366 RepID=A0A672R670_SINGR
MEQLAQEGKIQEKVYGKQKIYFADQSQFADVSDAELKEMDARVAELGAEVQTISQSCRQLDTGVHCWGKTCGLNLCTQTVCI